MRAEERTELPSQSTLHTKGLGIAALGGLVLTIDIPLIRLADGTIWSILLLRSGTTFAAALVIWGFLGLSGRRLLPMLPGRMGILVAISYGLSGIAFMGAVFATTTANLVFILAFNPMFAALLSWLFLKERPKTVTILAMVLMVIGVLIIVGDGLRSGQLIGDVLALLSALLIAVAITLSRVSGEDMGFAAIISNILPFFLAVPMVWINGFAVAEPGWILANGILIYPLAFFCLALAPRFISGAEVAMFYLLETVLTPIWIWMIFTEVPTRQSLIGGALLICTLIAHSLWQLSSGARERYRTRHHTV